jgi:carbonic anhydrase
MRFLILLLVGCAPPPVVHWNYGEQWTGVCSTGKSQSPIDLHGESGFSPRLQMEYWPSVGHVINNGHTIELEYDPGSKLIVDDKHYPLKQMHFHHPSEHLLDGKSFPLELHIVHKTDDGKIAVVGILIQEGAANKWLGPFFNDLPYPGEKREPGARINAADLIPASRVFLSYSGSLTTPPCTEGVSWFVMKTPIEMSAEQIAAFAKRFADDHRSPQPLDGRHAVEGEAH